MQILERIYYEWCEDLKDNEQVNKAMNKISSFDEQLRKSIKDDFFELDCAIMDFASESQKQGFMGGFEVCKQLLMGGKL